MSPRSGADSLVSSESRSRDGPDFSREAHLYLLGAKAVAGVDEAGRGPLAGPVIAAAIILDPARIPVGLDDSKKLTRLARETLFEALLGSATIAWASTPARDIDRINIRQATLGAMARAVAALSQRPDAVIIDGRDVPGDLPGPGEAIIGGDGLCLSVAAASIVAKVVRDRMMARACANYPGYGFSAHAGYGTQAHLGALGQLGPCPLHRLTFSPMRAHA